MIDVIVACTETLGIGIRDKLPWKCSDELKLFSRLTQDSILIVGKNTFRSLPYLPNRTIYVVTTKGVDTGANPYSLFSCPEHAIQIAQESCDKVFVAGGSKLYHYIFTKCLPLIRKVYLSVIKTQYVCDTFLTGFEWEQWHSVKSVNYPEFLHYELVPKNIENKSEKTYLELLKKVLTYPLRNTRNAPTFSTFSEMLAFDLNEGFPLITTKKMFWKGIVEELLFFWKGHTNSKELEEKGIMIWKGNTDRTFLDSIGMTERKEGMMGPMYGYQWRNFNANYDELSGNSQSGGYDQLSYIIELIKKDPTSRRIIMTAYNPIQSSQGVLYPCHSIILQFYVDGEYIDMYGYNRSSDLFLGLPFNIAMYALILTLVARITKYKPRLLRVGLGDAHVYQAHKESVELQLTREPYQFPQLVINKEVNSIQDVEKLGFEDFEIKNYQSHPPIKAKMIC